VDDPLGEDPSLPRPGGSSTLPGHRPCLFPGCDRSASGSAFRRICHRHTIADWRDAGFLICGCLFPQGDVGDECARCFRLIAEPA